MMILTWIWMLNVLFVCFLALRFVLDDTTTGNEQHYKKARCVRISMLLLIVSTILLFIDFFIHADISFMSYIWMGISSIALLVLVPYFLKYWSLLLMTMTRQVQMRTMHLTLRSV